MGTRRHVMSLRYLMLAILAVGGLIAPWLERERRWRRNQEELKLQCDVTAAILDEFEKEARPYGGRMRSLSSFSSRLWSQGGFVPLGSYPGNYHSLIAIEIKGGYDEVEWRVRPLEIRSHFGGFDARIINRLAREYRARGWSYELTEIARFIIESPDFDQYRSGAGMFKA
jgi:hypothetical protein